MTSSNHGRCFFPCLLVVISTATVCFTLFSAVSIQKLIPPLALSQSNPLRVFRGVSEKDANTDDDNHNHSIVEAATLPSRLWHNMTEEEQELALERVGLLIQKYGKLFKPVSEVHPPWRNVTNATMTLTDPNGCAGFGTGWGAHNLCGPAPTTHPCRFISFGISIDYSFDTELANVWQCRGFAGDPSIIHPSQLHPYVTFHNLAATTNEPDNPSWWTASIPSLVKFLRLDYVDVLKMDCEGCEYALPKDVLMEDPTFFHRVGQISLEVHVSKIWIHTNETLYYFGLLFELMEEAGLELAWSHIQWCGPPHEVCGCMPQFEKWGFSCGLNGTEEVVNAEVDGNKKGSCHNFLFARRQVLVTDDANETVTA